MLTTHGCNRSGDLPSDFHLTTGAIRQYNSRSPAQGVRATMLSKHNDPNSLDDEYECGGCKEGIVRLNPDGTQYRCNQCDFEMSYQHFKEIGLWVAHFLDQYPDVSADGIDNWLDEL
jgi:hypothetical protein